jgi:hypothetical protein
MKTVGTTTENLAGSKHAPANSNEIVESCVRNIRSWINVGVTRFSIDFPEMPHTNRLEWFADQVIPQFKS